MYGFLIARILANTFLYLLLIIFLFLLCTTQTFAFQNAGIHPSVAMELEPDSYRAENILLRYVEKNNLRADEQDHVMLQIFTDGYVSVYYPPYMRRSGKYMLYLNQNEMEDLWVRLSSDNVLQFDKEKLHRRLYTTGQPNDNLLLELSSVSDAETMLLELYPNRYKQIGFGDGSAAAIKNISWYGLRWDAKKFQEVSEIQDLISLHQMLLEIMQRTDLIHVKQ